MRQRLEAAGHRVGDRAADAGVDLVEDQDRRFADGGGERLERQHDARQLAPGGDARQRLRRFARIGGEEELDAVDAVCGPSAASSSSAVLCDRRGTPRRCMPSAAELVRHRAARAVAPPGAARADSSRATAQRGGAPLVVASPRARRRRASGVERGEVAPERHAARSASCVRGRRRTCGQAAQQRQALLDRVEPLGVGVEPFGGGAQLQRRLLELHAAALDQLARPAPSGGAMLPARRAARRGGRGSPTIAPWPEYSAASPLAADLLERSAWRSSSRSWRSSASSPARTAAAVSSRVLELEQLAPLAPRRRRSARRARRAAAARLRQAAYAAAIRARSGAQLAESVEQLAGGWPAGAAAPVRAGRRCAPVLAELRQQAEGGRAAVDVDAALAGARRGGAGPGSRRPRERRAPRAARPAALHSNSPSIDASSASAADELGGAAGAAEQRQRLQDDALAGAGLAGDDVQAAGRSSNARSSMMAKSRMRSSRSMGTSAAGCDGSLASGTTGQRSPQRSLLRSTPK